MQRLRGLVAAVSRMNAAMSRFWSKDRPWVVVIILSFVLMIVAQAYEMVRSNLVATIVFIAIVGVWLGIMWAAAYLKPMMPEDTSLEPAAPPATREGASDAA